VLLDANVIANYSVLDLLLRLSEEPRLLAPRWSEEILQEAKRTYTHKLRRPWPPSLVDHMIGEASRIFPEAIVAGHERWIEQCWNAESDRHVLAAAIESGAKTIVTYNLRDFPEEALSPWAVRAVSPDELLCGLVARHPELVVLRLHEIAAARGKSFREVLATLAPHTPKFAAALTRTEP
jgi:predicted nucleic acid-binding protein